MRHSHSPITWQWLHFDQDVTSAQTHDALAGLAVAPFAPVIALEVVAEGGAIRWRIGTAAAPAKTVARVLQAHVPGVRFDRSASDEELDRLSLAAVLRLAGSATSPLRTDAAQASTRSLFEQLAATRPGEMIRLQVVIGSRFAPRHPRDGEPSGTDLVRHFGEHGVRAAVRVGVRAHTMNRANALIRNVGAAWRELEVPGIRVELWRTGMRRLAAVRAPGWWASRLRVDDLALLVGWPVAADLPGIPAPHPRMLPPGRTATTGRRLGVAASDGRTPIRLSLADSLRHLHVLGPTGVGKSTLLAQLILQDAAECRGLVVVDPKGDLVTDVLARLPEHRLGDVVVLDPTADHVVGIDTLGGRTPDLAADTVLSVLHSLYADSWGPRLHDILHASLLTMARAGGLPLAVLPTLLTQEGLRREVTGKVAAADPLGVGAFWGWYEAQTPVARAQMVAPLMNKLRPLLMRPGLRATFGQSRPRFALADVFTRRRIVLVSLAKGTLGAEGAQLLGSVVVALLWQAALERTRVPADKRRPVMVYVDEVQDYLRLPGSLSDALAQARGLGVGFTLAHQHLGQLPKDTRAAMAANARSRVAFSLSTKDARDIAATTDGLLEAEDFTNLPAFHAYAQLLREGRQEPPVLMSTENLAAPLRPASELATASTSRYGRTVAKVDAELIRLVNGTGSGAPAGSAPTANPPPSAPGTPPGEQFGRRRRTRPRSTSKGESS